MLLIVTGLLATAATLVAGVCDKCSCDTTTGTVNCSSRGLIEHFDAAAWSDFAEKAQKIILSYNSFVHVVQFPNMSLATEIDLSHNRIEKIDDESFSELPNLRRLDLSYNELTSAVLSPHIFKGVYSPDGYLPLANLRELYLGNNILHTLPSGFFEHVMGIEVLALDGNPLRVIDRLTEEAIGVLPNLTLLDLSNTELTELPPYLLHTPKNLQVLNLSSNGFVAPPEALQHAAAIRELVLDNNPIKELRKGNFTVSDSLKVLRMNYMPELVRLHEGSVGPLRNLEEFYCSHNRRLASIDEFAFSSMPEGEGQGETRQWLLLKKLILNDNQLSTIESTLLARWDIVEELDLRANPWDCSCDSQWLLNVVVPIINRTHPEHLTAMTCHQPPQMYGRALFDLMQLRYHMRCADADGSHPEGDGRMLVGVLVGVLVTLPVMLAVFFFWQRRAMFFRYPSYPGDHYRHMYSSPADDGLS